MLNSSTNSGTDDETITETLLAGTYYVRVESQAAGLNAHVVRYGVSAPDADAVAALQEQSGTAVNAAPAFGQQGYTFDLAENADGSTNRVSLGTVAATDPEGTTLAYSLVGGNESGSFELDATSGELFYKGSGEDFESAITQFTLTVQASDGSETADTTVTVDVTDVNETPSFAEPIRDYAFDLEPGDRIAFTLDEHRQSAGLARHRTRPRDPEGHDPRLQSDFPVSVEQMSRGHRSSSTPPENGDWLWIRPARARLLRVQDNPGKAQFTLGRSARATGQSCKGPSDFATVHR